MSEQCPTCGLNRKQLESVKAEFERALSGAADEIDALRADRDRMEGAFNKMFAVLQHIDRQRLLSNLGSTQRDITDALAAAYAAIAPADADRSAT